MLDCHTPMSDTNEDTIGSMQSLGITRSYKLKQQVVLSAAEDGHSVCNLFCISSSTRSMGGRHSSWDCHSYRARVGIRNSVGLHLRN